MPAKTLREYVRDKPMPGTPGMITSVLSLMEKCAN
jgi:hypothetical protein